MVSQEVAKVLIITSALKPLKRGFPVRDRLEAWLGPEI